MLNVECSEFAFHFVISTSPSQTPHPPSPAPQPWPPPATLRPALPTFPDRSLSLPELGHLHHPSHPAPPNTAQNFHPRSTGNTTACHSSDQWEPRPEIP